MSDEEDKKCQTCNRPFSLPPNEIVICDRCDKGYHQLCHTPNIPSSILVPDLPWVCRQCFYTMTKEEKVKFKIFDSNWHMGPLQSSPEADDEESSNKEFLEESNTKLLYSIKNPSLNPSEQSSGIEFDELNDIDDESNDSICKRFPYNLSKLKWDEDHLTNDANVYCYCGFGVEYCRSMLQCIKCRQWFHTNCIQSLQSELLIGDQYFKFVCSVCNDDNIEICNRITMKWKVVVGLALSNLTYGSDRQFFNIKNDIIPFLRENEYQLKLSVALEKLNDDDLFKKIKTSLNENKDKFIRSKSNENDWSLNVQFPYVDPLTFSPYDDNQLSTLAKQKSASNSTPIASKNCLFHAVRKNSSPPFSSNNNSKKLLNKNKQDSKQRAIKRPNSATDHSNVNNCTKKPKLKKSRRRNSLSLLSSSRSHSNDNSDEKDIPDFDVAIPFPENFEGANNPFYCSTSSSTNNQPMSSIQNTNGNSNKLNNCNITNNSNNSNNLNSSPTLTCNLKIPLSPTDQTPEYRCSIKNESNKLVLSRVNSINENGFGNSSINTNMLNNKNGINKLSNGKTSPVAHQNEDKKDFKILGKRKSTQEGLIEYLFEYTKQE